MAIAMPVFLKAIVAMATVADGFAAMSFVKSRLHKDTISLLPESTPRKTRTSTSTEGTTKAGVNKPGTGLKLPTDMMNQTADRTRSTGSPPAANFMRWGSDNTSIFDFNTIDWSLCNASFHSNLAGSGPDSGEEALRFREVGVNNHGQLVDLVVTAAGNYTPLNSTVNGLATEDGCMGLVNVLSDTSVTLVFTTVLAGTNISMPVYKMFITLFDFDVSTRSVERATFFNPVSQLFYVGNYEFDISGDIYSAGRIITATHTGTGSDNPKDPNNLTDAQQRRTVMAEYVNQSEFRVQVDIIGGRKGRGRNFLFTSKVEQLPVRETFDYVNNVTTYTDDPDFPNDTCQHSCQIWADPHVSGFDNFDNHGPEYLSLYKHRQRVDARGTTIRTHTCSSRPVDVDAYEVGDVWLVKSSPVHIQARFRLSGEFIPDKAAVGAIAVGGSFISENTLVVEPLDGEVYFNGHIIPRVPWSDKTGKINVRFPSDADVELDLPMRVQLFVKRFPKHIDVKIAMPYIPGGVDGECGNYDGLAENDDETELASRGSLMVDDSMLLFETKFDPAWGTPILPDGNSGLVGTGFTEAQYQAVAALQDDHAMAEFVLRVLESEKKVVVPGQESQLEGFVPWFSGTVDTQSLQKMLLELSYKDWIQDAPAQGTAKNAANDKLSHSSGKAGAKDEPEHSIAKASSNHLPSHDELVSVKHNKFNGLCSECLLFGASHVFSFSAFRKHVAAHPQQEAEFRTQDWQKANQSIVEEGTYSLVKTHDVQIQGRFWHRSSDPTVVELGALAIGGSSLKGNKLIIRAGEVLWNEQRILQKVSSSFSNSFVTAEYATDAELVLGGELGQGITVGFKNGMSLTVNSHNKMLDARIRMCDSQVGAGGIEGECGTFEAAQHGEGNAQALGQRTSTKLEKSEAIFSDGSPRSFRVGDRVRVRQEADDPWFYGNVTSLSPLKVRPDYYDSSFRWLIVERI